MSVCTDREAEELAQRDPNVRAQRLARFKAATANRVWRYHPESGLTLLEPVLDASPKPMDPFHARYVA